MEIILFKKYLIRTDEHCFKVEKVKNDKPPIVKIKETKKGEKQKDYSNFKVVGYYSSLSKCIDGIRRNMLINDTEDVTTFQELKEFIDKMDSNINKELDKLKI